ncbi:Vacuolar protein sorting-associated protein 41-like protein [Smittium culicis]|uniref:Vacuolar protein sorting-associated protein 41-like protein n=1 Tax=Smittium culicis TaxID=133412 RepID=A0A1R1YM62_9FUNG|nr:Vacuolar protein sorting-associated protein 41-like protein [Smittium culicis]
MLLVYPCQIELDSEIVSSDNNYPKIDSESEITDPQSTNKIDTNSISLEVYPPELRVINKNHEEESNDILELTGYKKYKASDYNVLTFTETNDPDLSCWFIVSPKQIVEVKRKTFQQRLEWLNERRLYSQAFDEITDALIAQTGRFVGANVTFSNKLMLDIGQGYADSLISSNDYEDASHVVFFTLNRIRTHFDDGNYDQIKLDQLWEFWAYKLASKGHLLSIADYIPTDLIGINEAIYELILSQLLDKNVPEFCKTIERWPTNIYSISSIEMAVLDKLEKLNRDSFGSSKNSIYSLRLSLAKLLDRTGKIGKAIEHYLMVGYEGIIDRIENENLIYFVRDKALLIMQHDELSNQFTKDNNSNHISFKTTDARELDNGNQLAGVSLLVNNVTAIPPTVVVPQLVENPYYIYIYLHALRNSDRHLCDQFADIQVELYAEYNPSELLGFLRSSTLYSLGKANQICESRGLVPETIYLLGRMGDFRRALMMILYELKDVDYAIRFAKEQNDKDLWDDLINISSQSDNQSAINKVNDVSNSVSGDFMSDGNSDLPELPKEVVTMLRLALLSNADTKFVNPVMLLRSIPPSQQIPGIDKAVYSILDKYQLRVDLMKACNSVLNEYNEKLFNKSRKTLTKGVLLDTTSKCYVCNLELFPEESLRQTSLSPVEPSTSVKLVFGCGHAYHVECLLSAQVLEKVKLKSLVSSGAKNDRSGNVNSVDKKDFMIEDRNISVGMPTYRPGYNKNFADFERKNRMSFMNSVMYGNYFTLTKLDRRTFINQYSVPSCLVCMNNVVKGIVGNIGSRENGPFGYLDGHRGIEPGISMMRGISSSVYENKKKWNIPPEFVRKNSDAFRAVDSVNGKNNMNREKESTENIDALPKIEALVL